MSALSFEALSVELGGRRVLSGVSARLDAGLVAICGPNGAGKTTLLRAGLGLAKTASGRALLSGADVRSLSLAERARRAGYLPQERRVAWGVPSLRIAALGAAEASIADAEARGRAALAEVGLAGFEDRGVFDMSGGERARVLLARLFATGAPLLVLDEPAAGLDPEAQLVVLDLLRARAAAGAVVVVTLHDLGLAARYADRVVVLDRGAVAADAAPIEALAPPVLAKVFGLDGAWIETPRGPLLDARRR
ncbi:MAG TPA: ABC transporter ATP-binding protein [Caulobacteraceae bacterium]|nr:ABC transporter ATP-binding protein [Caulobacteraceae bacterium]